MDEYVRRSYRFSHAETLEVGPVASLPEPPEPSDLTIQKKNRQILLHRAIIYKMCWNRRVSFLVGCVVLCSQTRCSGSIVLVLIYFIAINIY